MTFVAPARTAAIGSPTFFGRRTVKPRPRILIADEDGARQALGGDSRMPPAATSPSLEHLARIALG